MTQRILIEEADNGFILKSADQDYQQKRGENAWEEVQVITETDEKNHWDSLAELLGKHLAGHIRFESEQTCNPTTELKVEITSIP